MTAKNLILVGPPGGGKGTQAERIVGKFGWPQISTGDILREAVRKGTEVGKEAKTYMDGGKLVPDAVLVKIIRDRLAEDDVKNGYILDGFPRTLPQAEALDSMLKETGGKLFKVILIDVADSELVARITGRRSCKACNAVFHLKFKPPAKEGVCDKCGKPELYQRDDDTEEKVRVRLDAYNAQTAAVIPYYEKQGLVEKVDGQKKPDEVFEQIDKIVGD